MRTSIWSGACAATVFGLGVALVGAQSASQPSQSGASKSITVTGCIQKAEQAPTGTAGTSGTTRPAASETKFLLTSAAMSPTGTSGTAGSAAPSTAVASEYRLDADDAKLTPHVGHKVEITGTPEQASSVTQAPSASAANAPKLKVDNVKMLATSCP